MNRGGADITVLHHRAPISQGPYTTAPESDPGVLMLTCECKYAEVGPVVTEQGWHAPPPAEPQSTAWYSTAQYKLLYTVTKPDMVGHQMHSSACSAFKVIMAAYKCVW
jgi:hypothetical protein